MVDSLVKVERCFDGLLIPIAQYILTQTLLKNEPKILSGLEFDHAAGFQDGQVDIDQTLPLASTTTAVYSDTVVKSFVDYNGFHINCYSPTRPLALKWVSDFEQRMVKENQFRGKCLYAVNGNLQFHKIPKVSWDDVVLDENTKKDIRMNTVSFLGDQKLSKVGVNKRGLIMFGPPGTGKTSVCKAIFSELENAGVSRIYVTAESFRRMGAGDLFNLLPYLGKTVLAFEDIDMLAPSRNMVIDGSGLLGDLLTNLDGMRSYDDPIVIMASTNKISMLDEALANRPCRFDRKVEIGLPTKAHIKVLYSKFSGVDVNDEIIRLSEGFTGSHIYEAVNTAKILAGYNDKSLVDCINEAVTIIRSNFFPGQSLVEIKAGVRKTMAKKGMLKKKAFNVEEWKEENPGHNPNMNDVLGTNFEFLNSCFLDTRLLSENAAVINIEPYDDKWKNSYYKKAVNFLRSNEEKIMESLPGTEFVEINTLGAYVESSLNKKATSSQDGDAEVYLYITRDEIKDDDKVREILKSGMSYNVTMDKIVARVHEMFDEKKNASAEIKSVAWDDARVDIKDVDWIIEEYEEEKEMIEKEKLEGSRKYPAHVITAIRNGELNKIAEDEHKNCDYDHKESENDERVTVCPQCGSSFVSDKCQKCNWSTTPDRKGITEK